MMWLLGLLWSALYFGQPVEVQDRDRAIFQEKIKVVEPSEERELSDNMMRLATAFQGTPYVGKTLEVEGPENLVVNLRGFDCTTFVETTYAMAAAANGEQPYLETFKDVLRRLRYRDGKIDGYPSRLHYISDWIYDAQQKGLMVDMTRDLDGQPFEKTINFMTTHTNAYRQLADPQNVARMQAVENAINSRKRFYIPEERVEDIQAGIRSGDVIAITTGIKGLDFVHMGLAHKAADGQVYLLHASSAQKQVVLDSRTLSDMLAANKSQTGIMVFRPQDAK